MKLILCFSPLALFLTTILPKIAEPIDVDKAKLDEMWADYKHRYNKTYFGFRDAKRRQAWEVNLEKIMRHNEEAAKGQHSFFIGDNHLSDMSTESYLQKMAKLTNSQHRRVDPERVGDLYEMLHHIPEEVNWLEKGFQMPAYNQKDCGSCYAFSIAGAIQAQIFKQTDKLVPLRNVRLQVGCQFGPIKADEQKVNRNLYKVEKFCSAQQIVDCSAAVGNYGCGGGSLRNTLKYLTKSGGLMAFGDYPYMAKQQKCHFDKHKALVNLTSWAVLPARDERALEVAVAKIGPVAASINASPHTFQLYHKGVYDDPVCTSNVVNHAMLVVGYTKDAWILKNWWGSHWGEKGYMKLKRRRNRCGVANYAAYALV